MTILNEKFERKIKNNLRMKIRTALILDTKNI